MMCLDFWSREHIQAGCCSLPVLTLKFFSSSKIYYRLIESTDIWSQPKGEHFLLIFLEKAVQEASEQSDH